MASELGTRPKVELSGEVICKDIANPRTVNRFVQKWIGRWIELRGVDANSPSSYFHVIFTREGFGPAVGCQMRLRIGNELWTGANYGQTISEALKQCLDHLNPISKQRLGSPLGLGQNLLSAATR